MKLNHAIVYGLIILGIAFLAYKNMPGMSGMFSNNSDGSALGGPVYSSVKANVGLGNFGGQKNSYGQSSQLLQSVRARFGRGQ